MTGSSPPRRLHDGMSRRRTSSPLPTIWKDDQATSCNGNLQGANTDAGFEHQQWAEMATDEYIQIMCCVLFLLCCFCCEEWCFCFFFHRLFFSTWWYRSSQIFFVSHNIAHFGVISHMSYSSRTKHHKHNLYQHLYSYNRAGGIIRHALLWRNTAEKEQEMHCNSSSYNSSTANTCLTNT